MRARSVFLTLVFAFSSSAAALAVSPCLLPYSGASPGTYVPATGPSVMLTAGTSLDQSYPCSNGMGQVNTVGDLTPAGQQSNVNLNTQMCNSNCIYQALDSQDPQSTLVPISCWRPGTGPSAAQLFMIPMLVPYTALAGSPGIVGSGGCDSSMSAARAPAIGPMSQYRLSGRPASVPNSPSIIHH